MFDPLLFVSSYVLWSQKHSGKQSFEINHINCLGVKKKKKNDYYNLFQYCFKYTSCNPRHAHTNNKSDASYCSWLHYTFIEK